MTIRARLSSCLVLFMVALAVGLGCATSGDGGTQAPGCTDPQISCGGACVDPTTDGQNCGACGNACPTGQGCSAGKCGACVAPQVACGAACVVLGTDNKNCGKCGNACGANQVCSNGTCGTHCGAGLTTCGGAGTPDAGDDASADAMTDATIDATVDATLDAPSDAPDDSAPAPDSAAPDAGGPLYCADTQNDPMNCGGCGVTCSAGHACKMGACQLDCPTGKHACNASDLCIPDGTCCTDSDCPVTGTHCGGPGDTCKCATGKKLCTASNSCIDQSACCTNADCAGIAGSTCSAPGGMCQCPSGQKACAAAAACINSSTCCTDTECPVMGERCNGVTMGSGGTCACPMGQKICPASNSCIPQTACCTAADCSPVTANVATAACTMSACAVATCAPGYVDINRTWTDGCECQDSANGKNCSGATSIGSLTVGQTTTRNGNLPLVGEENWFVVTFTGDTSTTYHPSVTLSVNPGNQFVFDILSATSCSGAALACGVEGGTSTVRTTWEVATTGGDPPNSNGHTGEPKDGHPNYTSTPAVGSVYIRVYRLSGNPTCDGYTLTIGN